jgi:CheY-like chemotaxis protein
MLPFSLAMDTTIITQGKRILLVDDDAPSRTSIKLLLSIDRHTVTEAANASEALVLFTGAQYDLVIVDYFMPDTLGEELIKSIRQLVPQQPVLMVTAYLEKLVDGGQSADIVLGKPLNRDDLRRAITKLTG